MLTFRSSFRLGPRAHGPLCTFQCGCVFLSGFVSIAVLSCQNRGGRPLWVLSDCFCNYNAFCVDSRHTAFPPLCLCESLLTRVHIHYENIISFSSAHTKLLDRVPPSHSCCGNLHLLKCGKSKNGRFPSWLSFSRFVHNGFIQDRPPTKQCQTKLEREKCEGETTRATGLSPTAPTVYLPERAATLNSPEGGDHHPGNSGVYRQRHRMGLRGSDESSVVVGSRRWFVVRADCERSQKGVDKTENTRHSLLDYNSWCFCVK